MKEQGVRMAKTRYRNRGEAASDCIERWLEIERDMCSRAAPGEVMPRLNSRQRRTLKLQIRQAIVRWESSMQRAQS